MRIVFYAVGTRGDVQPVVALAGALTTRGHEVVVGVNEDLVGFARRAGVDARPLGVDAHRFLRSPAGQQWLAGGDVRAYLRELIAERHRIIRDVQRDMGPLAGGADVVVGTRLIEEEASTLAEWQRVPFLGLHYAPVRPNSRFASVIVTPRRLPAPLNRLTHVIYQRRLWHSSRADLNAFRHSLGLPPAAAPADVRLAAAGVTDIQAYSRFLLPELAGWGATRPLVGSPRLSATQRAALGDGDDDPGLTDWLAAGDPPVYFGFGSMPVQDPARVLDLIRTAARRMGVRALVGAGWSDMAADTARDPDVRVVTAVDHDAVLPGCRAAVHHGGSGSTAASLRAGLPTVICSVFSDQPFWGRVVRRLGVGDTFRYTALSADRLVRATLPLLADGTAARAAALAEHLRTEDSTGEAATLIERAGR
ncbi:MULTISPECIES: glycosyltransferase [Catenuloplanes]|uniref:UDP:flavonoid glycosyltransferase YjiC (YdhE family) n=1 Tax=Catenuloplanes niger TaxID=587534 RepID=A0AAE3ZL51_9ACTN|nr:glycosyltransferase [Catenuloplanes niger]MDR7320691.1 UDP:flavonoid glycosyltransferase YjiC (YdhE family) [Catenuloplanes niger]